ncbi:UvrD-helicase domain-containing protein [Marinobacter fonticola]|uniref:UvrD-helicase domain-containing protein n=1 Tax=Marinobacter fonticola TaxID=2603215 RepID=UPI0011E640CB|nr:ATP-dependent helicase [Marinobacter fonticola]
MSMFRPTPEQKSAIDYDYTMVITACPGSGKTAVMKEKIRKITPNLPSHKGVIAITFTKKASQELKHRCNENAHDTKQSFFGTIDSFCVKELIMPFLSRLWGGKPADCTIVKRLESPYSHFIKEEYRSPTATDIVNDDGFRRIYEAGVLWMNSFAALALLILNSSESARRYVKARYSHVFIDEYQDSSLAQHELFIKLLDLGLVGAAVGDISQSIYEFRGGNPALLRALVDDTDRFKHFEITINHRCHPSIINYASRVLDSDFRLIDSDEIRVFRRVVKGSLKDAGSVISGWLSDWLNKGSWGIEKASDVAILAKRENSLKLLMQGLDLDYRVYFDSPLDAIGTECSALYSRLLAFKFGAIPTVQDLIDDQFEFVGQKGVSIPALRKKIIGLRAIEDVDRILTEFNDLSVLLDMESDERIKDAVRDILANETIRKQFMAVDDNELQVMTLHKSKGLEFKLVFHFDLEEWSFPFRQFVQGDWDNPVYPNLSQDENLHYVGITRAENFCCLIRVTLRQNAQGNFVQSQPSYFLSLPQLEGFYS